MQLIVCFLLFPTILLGCHSDFDITTPEQNPEKTATQYIYPYSSWNNIRPGVSTKEDVKESLGLPAGSVATGTLLGQISDTGTEYPLWWYGEGNKPFSPLYNNHGKGTVEILYNKETVFVIYLWFWDNGKYQEKYIVDQFGKPELIFYEVPREPIFPHLATELVEANLDWRDATTGWYYFYPNQGVGASLGDYNEEYIYQPIYYPRDHPPSDVPVLMLMFFKPMTKEEFLASELSPPLGSFMKELNHEGE